MELVQMQKGLQDYTKSLFLDVSFCYTESPLLKKKRSFCYSHFLLEIEYEGWLFKKKKKEYEGWRKCFRSYTKTGVYG